MEDNGAGELATTVGRLARSTDVDATVAADEVVGGPGVAGGPGVDLTVGGPGVGEPVGSSSDVVSDVGVAITAAAGVDRGLGGPRDEDGVTGGVGASGLLVEEEDTDDVTELEELEDERLDDDGTVGVDVDHGDEDVVVGSVGAG